MAKKKTPNRTSESAFVQILQWLGYGALALAPFSLLYIDSNLLFPFVTGKAYVWRTLVIIALAAWASLALTDPRYRFSVKNPLFLSVSVFITVMGLATIFADNSFRSFWSNAERMDGYVGLLHLYAYFVAFIGMVHKKSVARIFLGLLLGAGFIISLIGLGQLDEVERIYATLGNPIYLGSLTLFCIFISGYFFFRTESFLGGGEVIRKLFFGFLGLFFIWVLFETITRGALLGLAVGGFAATLYVSIWGKSEGLVWWKRLSVIYVTIFLVFGGLFIFAKDWAANSPVVSAIPIIDRVFDVSFEDNTTIHRLENWNIALQGVSERPVLGWGQESYITVFSKYYDPDELWDAEQWFDRTHNTYLDWLLFGGIAGLTAFLLLFVALLFVISKRTEFSVLEKASLIGLVFGYLAQNFVAFDSLVSGIYLYAFIAFVFVMMNKKEGPQPKQFPEPIVVPMFIAVWVGALLSIIYFVYIPRQTNQLFLTVLGANDLSGNTRVENLRKAIDAQTSYSQEIFEQTSNRLPSIIGNTIYSDEEKLMIVDLVRNEGKQLLEKDPDNVRVNLFYGAFLLRLQENKAALPYLERAVELSPKKPTILLAYGQALYQAGDPRYRQVFEELRELVPQDPAIQEQVERFLSL